MAWKCKECGSEVVMWSRVEGYLKDLSYTLVCTERKEERLKIKVLILGK